MGGNFDETCPHCGRKITNLYDYFVSHDYATEFTIDCPCCDDKILVAVHAVPEFETLMPD
jgi:hypothetical protein